VNPCLLGSLPRSGSLIAKSEKLSRYPHSPLSLHIWPSLTSGADGPFQSHTDIDTLPAVLPRTIEDCITVAIQLGYRHLWVDRYCIRQSDKDDVKQQINFMSDIYGCADATIVASAGKDPTYGLPGVEVTPRLQQAHAELGSHTWVDSLSSPESLDMPARNPNGILAVGPFKTQNCLVDFLYLRMSRSSSSAAALHAPKLEVFRWKFL
jgi:hypothetical protein